MKIIENTEEGTITINGKTIHGFIDDVYQCKICDGDMALYQRYDAYFCPECNEWGEKACEDPDCYFCQERPEKPL